MKNLHAAWIEFESGKWLKADVAEFNLKLPQNVFSLHEDLKYKRYIHGSYEAFKINDPKPRDIHKATVRDRLLHHAIYRILSPIFDRRFIYDSYSCRFGKGTHRALERFKHFSRKVSKNNRRTCWTLKCDVRKFFASIDHEILVDIVRRHITDADIICLLQRVVESFSSIGKGKGLPLGNLTSQMLVNVYMNEFDQFVKHGLKQKYYVRYADDFVIMNEDVGVLMEVLPKVHDFLEDRLKLSLHPKKVSIRTVASGVDFLGWVHFPKHRVLRSATKYRMFRRLESRILGGNQEKIEASRDSYLGMLKWGNTYGLSKKVRKLTKTSSPT